MGYFVYIAIPCINCLALLTPIVSPTLQQLRCLLAQKVPRRGLIVFISRDILVLMYEEKWELVGPNGYDDCRKNAAYACLMVTVVYEVILSVPATSLV